MRRHRDSREVVDGESTVGFDWTDALRERLCTGGAVSATRLTY